MRADRLGICADLRGEHEGPFRLPPAEIECGEWFTVEQLRRWIAARPEDFATGFLECWRVWVG